MNRNSIISYRLKRHHLTGNMKDRLPHSKLEDAFAAAVQNTTPGTVPMAAAIRVKDFELKDLDRALRNKKTLVDMIGIRGANYIIPSKDFSVFSQAVYPTTEKEMMAAVNHATSYLKSKKMNATDVLEKVAAVTMKILNKKALTQDEIHAEWRKALPKEYLMFCRGCDSFHLSYSIVSTLGLRGIYCFGPIKDGATAYVRTDQWLPKKDIDNDLESTREKLIRRFFHFFGPSNLKGLQNGLVSVRSWQKIFFLLFKMIWLKSKTIRGF